MKKYLIGMTAIAALTFTSCNKEVAPTITVTSPANHSHHAFGGHIDASATFEDKDGLASYHIHIGNEDGSHYHDWMYEDEQNISGKSYDWTGHLIVPDSCASMLWLHFEVTDADGTVGTDKIMLHFD